MKWTTIFGDLVELKNKKKSQSFQWESNANVLMSVGMWIIAKKVANSL